MQNAETVVEEGVGPDGDSASRAFTAKPASPEVSKLLPQEQVAESLTHEAGKRGSVDRESAQQNNPPEVPGATINTQVAAEIQETEVKLPGNKETLHQNILSQVRDGVLTHDGKGNGQMSIRLNPGELGELKILVRMEDNRLKVEVQAENRVVKDLLMGNLDTLREALSLKNFSMERFNVSTSDGGFNNPLPEERGNSRQQRGHRFTRGGGYTEAEGRVSYLTAEVNTLLDVRF